MKVLYRIFMQFFIHSSKVDSVQTENKNFFDYSSGERIKIMRAAGRDAQKEQKDLLKTYEARFGRV